MRSQRFTTFSRSRGGGLLIFSSAAVLFVAAIASLAIGPTGISLDDIGVLFDGADDQSSRQARLVLFDLRLPRTIVGVFVGASLAVSGAMLQGLFRNPLADPSIIGVSGGAALAAVTTIALADGPLNWWAVTLGVYALPVSAFLGGITTTALLMLVAGRGGQMMMGTLLLAGIAFAALAMAGTGLVAFVSDDDELRDLTLWQLGSLSGSSWDKVLGIAPFAVVLLVALPTTVRALNGLLLGEAEAFHLGINVERMKLLIVTLAAAAVGSAVAVAGIISFIGIVVPHLVRLLVGPDHRILLPAAALIGASLMVLADIVARMIVQPAELPIGIVMAMIGAPVFLHIVLRRGYTA
ncbi:MAG: iron ABC transporter permease [Pseudomonadota bacterium]